MSAETNARRDSWPRALGNAVAGLVVGMTIALYLMPDYEAFAPIGIVLFGVALVVRVGRKIVTTSAAQTIVFLPLLAGGYAIGRLVSMPKPAELAVIALANLASIGPVVVTYLSGRQKRELDRAVFVESAALAFFTTMLAQIAYSFAEAWVDAPRLPIIAFWGLGMAVWYVATVVVRRRYS